MADDVKPTVKPSTGGTGGVAGAAEGLAGKLGANNSAEQFLIWAVLSQIVGAALTPAITAIVNTLNQAEPLNALSPQQLAVASLRDIIDPDQAASDAELSGINNTRFQQLVDLAKSPPQLGLLIQAAQRQLGQVGPGMAADVNLEAALTDLGIDKAYHPLVMAQVFQAPTQQEIYLAWLQGQIEEGEAVARLQATGLDPSWITTGYNAQGEAPTPNELLDLWNRGIISESGTGPDSTSYEQGFLEGPARNKWLNVFKALRLYFPPPRTTQAMLREGSISSDLAAKWFANYGVEGDVLTAFMTTAHATTSVAQKTLTQAQIIDLYESKLISRDEAHADLVAARFTTHDADYLLELADLKAAAASTKSAVTRLQNLYLAGTNDAVTTQQALHELGLTDANVTALLATWNLEQATVVKALSEAQNVAAWFYGGFGDPTSPAAIGAVVARLQNLGYSQPDALLLLTARWHSVVTLNGVAS